MLGPRVRVRVRPRCDEDGDECPSPWAHPAVVAVVSAVATAAASAIGEVWVRRKLGDRPEKPETEE